MTGAELLVRCLEREGVRYVFGVPGEETLDVNDALARSSITFVPVRHEQAAAFMADVWGRLTGEAGVCLATLGPGATNLATGLADANLDRAPAVAITGQLARDLLHKESHQYVDIVDVFRPFTKWNARVETGAVVAEAVRKAFKRAQEEKPGACHLELPEDVAHGEAEGEPLAADRPRRPSPDRPSLARAADVINQATRPLILAGNGVIRGHASAELTALAERARIPVVTTFMAKGAIPADHPLARSTVGLASDDPNRVGFTSADVVIAVGYDPVEYGPAQWNPSGRLRIVHVDFTAAEVDARYQPAVEVVADVREALELLAPLVAVRPERVVPPRQPDDPRRLDDSFPLLPQRIIADLEAVLRPDDLVISDVGAHKLWVAKRFHARVPNTVIISNGFAAMGIGLPGAIAAKLARPERRVVTVTGDGAVMMNIQELETAVRLGVAFVVLIFRDDGYGVIRWKQQRQFGRTAGVEFGNPDFVALARAFGCEGVKIVAAKELRPALERALTSRVPVVIDCPVDYRENDRLADY
ncbi:MAG TPA: acetolactate synthase large subunit [Candidatus Acidoferrum sp.]|jgi:acetolactate synthase-1/2/3 large subunit|nr:acetolactate synthase large subunit [Candidatus Acidoferrum sp.]